MASSSNTRGATWSHEEILALIRIWSDLSIQEALKKPKRHGEIYRKIAEDLAEAGYTRTQKQVTDKIKNLRQYYKEIRDGHNKSGYDRDNWPYFDLIDAVLGDRPSTRPHHLIDTTEPVDEDEDSSYIEYASSNSVSANNTSAISTPGSEDIGCTEQEGSEEEEDNDDDGEGQLTNATQTSTQRRSRDPPTRPPASKRSKKTGIERALSSFTDAFLQHQMEMEERMMAAEERRRKEDMKQMEKMRKDDREHELRLFQVLGQMMGPPQAPSQYYVPPPHPSSLSMPLETTPPSQIAPYPPVVGMYPSMSSPLPATSSTASPQSDDPSTPYTQ